MLTYSFILTLGLVTYVSGGCPALTSIYNPAKVNCPQCTFYSASSSFIGSGSKRTLNCPPNYEVWYYSDKGQEFVTPVPAIQGAYVQCAGSKWKFVAGGRTTFLKAIACALQ